MRRTRFMSWLFLVLSLAFFLVRDFRFALEAPLANYWWQTQFSWAAIEKGPKPSRLENLYTLKRFASTQKLVALADEAGRRGDNKFVAFAALNLPIKEAKAGAMRLADKAVRGDRELTWIYFPLAYRLGVEEGWQTLEMMTQHYLRLRIEKLQAFDPDNAAPHLLHAQMIQGGRGKEWPDYTHYGNSFVAPDFLGALARETEWRKEMEAAFASPRYDSYKVREFDLYRHVLRERGWDHPAVAVTLLETPIPNLLWLRNYTNLLVLKLGADAEAAGQLDKALGYYWEAARFGNRMRLQAPSLIEWLIAVACQFIAYDGLAPALRKAGRDQEAVMVEDMRKQTRSEMSRYRGPLDSTYNRFWSAFLVNFSAGLVWAFSLLTLVSLLYVNAKQWVRKEKKGRVFEILTIAENYLPVLLFLSCLALYLSFLPFGHNFAHYMTTEETITNMGYDLTTHMYPAWQLYSWPGTDLALPNPFQDYIPYALSGIVLLVGVMAFPRLRRGAKEGAPEEDVRSIRRRRVNAVVYALFAAVGVLLLATPWPWEKSLPLVGVAALLLWGLLQVTSSYARRSRDPGANVRRVRVLEAGAYVLLLAAAAVAGLIFPGSNIGVPTQALVPVTVPLLVGGVVGAIRMRLRLLTPFLFVVATFGASLLSSYLQRETPKPPPKAPLVVFDFLVPLVEGKPQEQLVKQVAEQGVVFPPRVEYLGILREAGAGENLLQALRGAKGRWSQPARPEAQAMRKAEQDLRAAIKVNPNSANLHFALGWVLEQEGNMADAAILEFREALRLNPSFAGARRGLGWTLLSKRQEASVIPELRPAVRLDPQDALAHYQLGGALLNGQKDVGGAIAEFRQVVRLEPGDDWAHATLGNALLRKHDVNGAIAEYHEALRLEPRIADHHLGLGEALHEKGDRQGAKAEYLKALDLYSTDLSYRIMVANLLEGNGDLEEAISTYRNGEWYARNDAGAEATFHDLAGRLLVKKGELDGAIAEFHDAMRLAPTHAEPVVDLGRALEKMGNLTAALDEYRAALKLDPANDDARADTERLSHRVKQKR